MTISISSAQGERDVVDAVRIDDAWRLIEQFAKLVRGSGTDEERQAVNLIADQLKGWGVPHQLHEPELLISLPIRATLTVNGRTYAAKTPSMAKSTGPKGITAPLTHISSAAATSVNDLFAAATGTGEVAGKFVVTEGLPMPGKVADLEARGAVGVVCISPGERIHEGICTTIWGAPDLTSYRRKPNIPVVSVNKTDGGHLVEQLRAGDLGATMVAEHEERWRKIPVVVAEFKGSIEPERFVLLHGHLDSWHVGIGDNATGNATLLEVARVLGENRDKLARSVRIAWWSGHSHGRYAGSTWFADNFANDLLRNCICHINCDSPGCRDATVYEDVYWTAEIEAFAKQAIKDLTGVEAHGRMPIRAGDISFNNLGISTFLMLSSTMPDALREERGLYAVGGCGGNIEWHTEADTMEVADRDNLLRDMRLYAGAVVKAANQPLHPLDFRPAIDQIEATLQEYQREIGSDLNVPALLELSGQARASLDALYRKVGTPGTVPEARKVNDVLIKIGRTLVSLEYSREGRYRQDPALTIPLLPDFAAAIEAKGSVALGIYRTELTRARNRLEGALLDVTELASTIA
jgi:N-acetylated-alpha-linked acidic dipeptidase